MNRYTEEDLNSAIQSVANGQSVKKAAIEWGIPRSTLRTRLNGALPRDQAFSGLQRLSKVQEDYLTQWVLTQAALGLPPTHAQLKEFAGRILRAKGDHQPIGKRWIEGFLRRNPVLKVQRAKSIDSKRVNGATTDIIREWFKRLQIPVIQRIKTANRWNMDEAGLLEGQGHNGLVLGNRESRAILKKTPGSRAWTSFVECVSATGKALHPLVIFKGMTVQQQWFPLDLKPFTYWEMTATPNGWICDDSATEWLEKVFIPQSRPENPSEARLLILDGHGSHETTEFMWLCFTNNIYLLFLPPHSSHVLQPLDLSIFSPLKRAYCKRLNVLVSLVDSTVVGKRNFLSCYREARLEALTVLNIKGGWKASGLWPVNMAKPLLSPLLLENSNKVPSTPDNSTSTEVRRGKITSDYYLDLSAVVWSTPKKSVDLREQLRLFGRLEDSTITQRLLFSKVRKAFDEKDVQLAAQKRQIESLETQIDANRARKRKKVRLSPNSKFANIEAIRNAQIEAGDATDGLDEERGSDLPSETGSCIVVDVRGRVGENE
jgi:hypothetical protein